ncbi:hypothetical protein QYE76_042329 [Lolium multiflorum]|uniref:Retrotransposon Copia-like N-terminal domain-containing protein n=1 Tax=Lolium multiflorum TaxID=4521 RepID=A0AAD8WWV1_LOLMU|nr:hypothetical protein QYE76_042329 [Lolium multiflorum]
MGSSDSNSSGSSSDEDFGLPVATQPLPTIQLQALRIRDHVLVILDFDKENYGLWHRQFLTALAKFGLTDHVDGSRAQRSSDWVLNNFAILSWHSATGDHSIVEYTTRLKQMADTLRDLGAPVKERELVRVVLRGLDERLQNAIPYLTRDRCNIPVVARLLATADVVKRMQDDARCQGPLSGLGTSRLFVLLNHCPPVGFGSVIIRTLPVGTIFVTSTSTSAAEMADEPVTYADLPEEHKKKYDELKAIVEAELIGPFEKTRSHGIKVKGGTRSSPGVNMVDLSHSIREPWFSLGVNMAGFCEPP